MTHIRMSHRCAFWTLVALLFVIMVASLIVGLKGTGWP